MVEHIKRRSAIDGAYTIGPFGAVSDTPGVRIHERRDLTIIHVDTGDDPTCDENIAAAVGHALPDANRSVDGSGYRIIWAGPGRWLVIGQDEAYGTTASKLSLVAANAAFNDVSSSRAVIRISGNRARDVLAAGCTIDLHPDVFGPGRSATTDIDHVAVTLDCIDRDTFDVYVPRGFALSFWEWLLEAAAEHGGEIVDA